jgi:hypothetical protein
MQRPKLDHWPAEVGEHARSLKLIRAHEGFVVGGPHLGDDELEAVSRDVATVLDLVAALPRQLFGSDLSRFGQAVGFTSEETEIMLWSGAGDTARGFARADLARTANGFRLLELNVGSSVGGMAEASMPSLLGIHRGDSPLAEWASMVAARVRGQGHGAIVEDDSIFASERARLEVQAEALRHSCGVPVDVVSHRSLHYRDGGLWGEGGAIGWIYPAYTARDVAADRVGYRPLQSAIQAGAVAMPVDLVVKLLGSKALLAVLWSRLDDGVLDEQAAAAVCRLVPRTRCLRADLLTEAIDQQKSLVLKPAVGAGGVGVRVGREADSASWRQVLDEALSDPARQYVLQDYHPPIVEPAVIAGPQALQQLQAHFIWGIYVADGQPMSRPLMRCRALGGSMVINYAAGAMMGSLGPGGGRLTRAAPA